MLTWKTDWCAFVEAVRDAYSEGLGNDAVTEQFMNQPVTWVGRVSQSRLNDDDPGVEMEMTPMVIELADGRRSTVDFIFIRMASDQTESWRGVESGTIVRFSTIIAQGHGPFSGIRWSDLSGGRGVIQFSTRDTTLIDSDCDCAERQ